MPDLVAVAVNVDTTSPTSANQPLVMILMMMVVHVIDNDVDDDHDGFRPQAIEKGRSQAPPRRQDMGTTSREPSGGCRCYCCEC